MKKLTGRVTSVSLAFVMAASVFQTLPQTAQPVMADETEDTTAQLTSKVIRSGSGKDWRYIKYA